MLIMTSKKISIFLILFLPFSTALSADLVVKVRCTQLSEKNFSQAIAEVDGKYYRAVIGKYGATTSKVEGDLKTPLGKFPLRFVYYRPDKFPRGVVTGLPQKSLTIHSGWCDDTNSIYYNQAVRWSNASHPSFTFERLWRADDLYDLIVVVGYNDHPIKKGRGSAIFIHIASRDYHPTAGCIAFSEQDLLAILSKLDKDSHLVVTLC